MTSYTNLRLPAAELSKLEPARPRPSQYVEPPAEQPVPVRRRVRRAIRDVVGYARA
jgi:hypothetical protein